jgi:hypothetical protein
MTTGGGFEWRGGVRGDVYIDLCYRQGSVTCKHFLYVGSCATTKGSAQTEDISLFLKI